MTTDTTNAIAASGLTVRFGNFTAVGGVDLGIAAGSRHALIGPNGAGKTTLVHALTGGLRPTAGSVHLGGRDVTRLREAGRVRLGLARTYQINQLFRGLSVLDNVMLAIFERDRKTFAFWRRASRDSAVIEEARGHLAFVNLADHAERIVATLPYGLQRLLEIAVALATKPKVLVLDEPAAGVPAAQSEAIFERIHALPRELTLVFVEHDMNLVFRFAERITVLVAGRVLTEGTPAEISADERVREVYLGRRGHHAAA
ncbi:ABC transporter ATP-binding protein [Bradyrhizobium sp. U87765 SZCCT0131]|uniref:ABC transporter ATP-binding protein n=1 Tax=unclassified Bradyrhizobium TaxID=2631580 RepID=UPI001BAC118B|nr:MULTISPECIES: ABC transporter ATP-binding protein [unclassified Bradyrhizobium]MBR1219055.1 ABC transporter ATP-binding protein [Bradyrhizobium sp. U87765 SZCCT0131]MBR1261706.1 ABC transporter ATP-binding protein [Bradyrhizobium sp. U87765 SZCCT0134]MBR1306441.1 ABC transporter ATP-binding protein [Bradyrhizobium sp. U87765 SZCCT0110]MBR1317488.1 ABC transporter ATP-binding protein [Bradyrhizobium sp. U87765 SZCCT0109]MBR1351190.1 ABC transporter ATP-binding protein [Bradyrhizobium sp. U87